MKIAFVIAAVAIVLLAAELGRRILRDRRRVDPVVLQLARLPFHVEPVTAPQPCVPRLQSPHALQSWQTGDITTTGYIRAVAGTHAEPRHARPELVQP